MSEAQAVSMEFDSRGRHTSLMPSTSLHLPALAKVNEGMIPKDHVVGKLYHRT